MQRRKLLTGAGAALLASRGSLYAFSVNSAVFALSDLANSDTPAVGEPVNLFPFGHIQSWLNPEISAQIRSTLGSWKQNNKPLQLGAVTWKGSEFDLGVEWPEPRTIERIAVCFSGHIPSADWRLLEIWDGLTGKQGNWKPVQPGSGDHLDWPSDHLDSETWTVQIPATRTFKVRLRIRDKTASVAAVKTYSPARWKVGEVRIEWGQQSKSRAFDGRLEIYNGKILRINALGTATVQSSGSWIGGAGNGNIGGIVVKLLYTSGMDVDRTILTIRSAAGDFSFLPREALEEQAIYVPDFGVFVRDAAASLSFEEYRSRHRNEFRIADAVTRLPEQTLDQAYQKIDADRVVAFVGVDSNSQKFGIAPSGHVIIGYDDPSFGGIIKPKYTFHFDCVELPTVFDSPDPPPNSLFRTTLDKKQRLAKGWLPVVITEWGSTSDVSYERTDFAALPGQTGPIDQSRLTGNDLSVMISRLRIRNNSPVGKTIHFYIKPWKPAAGFPYGAIPQDAKDTWETTLTNDCITVIDENLIKAICWIDIKGKGLLGKAPSIGAVRYSVELNGDEVHEINMMIPGRPIALDDIATLSDISYQKLWDATEQYWEARLGEGMQLEVPDEHIQNLYRANLQHFLVTLTKDPKRDEYYPNTATFYYGAIGSESSPIIQALDMRGMHKLAEKCLNAFLSTQGDAVPEGEFKEQEGGFYHYWPWYSINQGFVIWALAEHYLYSGDKEWLERVAPQIVAGCEFILRGRKLTKKDPLDGERTISYGFAPAGTIGDPTSWKYSFMISGIFYLGLKKCAEALKDVDPENAARFGAEAADFLSAIRAGLKESTTLSPVARLRDGTSVPATPPFVTSRGFTSDVKDNIDPDPRFSYASDCVVGALQMVKCEVLEAHEPEVDWLLNILEDRFFMFSPYRHSRVRLDDISMDWFNLGGFDKMQPYYLDYQEVYLQRDQVPNFLRGFFNTLAAIADKQNLSFQEELGGTGGQPQKTHEEARFLQQLRRMLLMEKGQTLYLARGTPRSWLEDGKSIAMSRAPSYFGELSFRVQSFANQGRIDANIQLPSRKRPFQVYLRLRHPTAAQLKHVVVNGRRWNDFDAAKEWISLPVAAEEVTLQAFY